MKINQEQEAKAKQQFLENIEEIDDDDVEYAAKKGAKKVESFGDSPPDVLTKLWRDIQLMIGLITDYVKGHYTDIPWKALAAIAGAILYFVSPIDVIPDFIPVLGYFDDALVIKLALDFAGDDLQKYAHWKAAHASE